MREVKLRLSDDVLAKVDEARGEVPRERWIRTAIVMRLNGVPAPIDPPPATREPSKPAAKARPEPPLPASMNKHKFVRESESMKLRCKECTLGPNHPIHG